VFTWLSRIPTLFRSFHFIYKSKRIEDDDTPASLGMQNGDEIRVVRPPKKIKDEELPPPSGPAIRMEVIFKGKLIVSQLSVWKVNLCLDLGDPEAGSQREADLAEEELHAEVQARA